MSGTLVSILFSYPVNFHLFINPFASNGIWTPYAGNGGVAKNNLPSEYLY